MLDPLTAASLASSIVQFVDYGTKIVINTKEIYESASGATDTNERLDTTIDSMMGLYKKLSAENPSHQGDAERALCHIAKECHSLSKDISAILQKIKPKKANSIVSSYMAAGKAMWYSKEIAELKARLDSCQSQLSMPLSVLTRFLFRRVFLSRQ
jgi:N-terminal domain on NACHT_NTPase and P-loop NTPases